MENERKEYEQRIIAACQKYGDTISARLGLNTRNKFHKGVDEGLHHGIQYAFLTMLHSDSVTPQDLLGIIERAIDYQNLYNIK